MKTNPSANEPVYRRAEMILQSLAQTGQQLTKKNRGTRASYMDTFSTLYYTIRLRIALSNEIMMLFSVHRVYMSMKIHRYQARRRHSFKRKLDHS
jgi:hypothetical protein